MIEFKYITEEQAAKMFCHNTGSTNQNLCPELAADFGQLFHGKKMVYSAVKLYLLDGKNDLTSVYDHAKKMDRRYIS